MEIVKGSLQSCTQRNWMGETGQMENNTKPHKIIWDISHIIKARENSFKFFQRNIYTAKQPSDCNYHFHSFLSPHSFLLILYTYGICIFHVKCSLLLLLHISKYFSHTFSVCGKSIFLCVCICLYSWKSVGNISAAVKYWEHTFEISLCVLVWVLGRRSERGGGMSDLYQFSFFSREIQKAAHTYDRNKNLGEKFSEVLHSIRQFEYILEYI